jgi:hypothetical protein
VKKYFTLSPHEEQELKSNRTSFLYRQCQCQSGGNTKTNISSKPALINGATTREITVGSNNNNGDNHTSITITKNRSIFAASNQVSSN